MADTATASLQGLQERTASATFATRFQFVDVTFTSAHVDTPVEHSLQPVGGEQIGYLIVQRTGPAHIYQDASTTRRAWSPGQLLLRSDTANVRVRLLLFLPPEEQRGLEGVGTLGVLSFLGGQTQFPATQVPSSDANTLDDYEEGTWTPSVTFGGGSTGMTYAATRTGHYVKVGKVVYASFRLVLTAKGSSTGNAQLSGLPFTSANDSIGAAGDLQASNMTGLTGYATGLYVQANGTTALLTQGSATGDVQLTHAVFTNTTDLAGSVVYLASQ